ncbi:DUF2797 domain-containing protein [Natrinema salifodinae]|uniref:DUF2797 domain-containing protein n=1 Tax=Natrinema salifodinae TaxID=1202768 RepID=A0A1I0NB29_9EURY|nr:DUF2797 domain-containing protein [Natrinema salifodinae]SEV97999.1 Protein of unknown function [Natrinema salifodinae]
MQLVGYRSSGNGSALLISDADADTDGDENGAGATVDPRPVASGDDLAYSLGERRCAGAIDEDGTHVTCDRSSAPYCEYHTSTWVCARCTGTCLKDEMDCYEDHAVYIAAFAPDTFKVGVTRSWRLETRLREQGADRAAHIHTVSNGRVAREIEAEIAERLVDRVRTPTKVASLAAAVDETAWRDLLAEFDVIEEFDFDYGIDLDARPVRETIASGTVVGVKGRLLVLDHGGTTYAVDMRDLVGHELKAGRTDRDLQSSLGSFG